MLRLVSFNMDYYWACTLPHPPEVRIISTCSDACLNILSQPESTLTEKERAAKVHPLEYYTYANYIAYVLFPPLYIAGPILTFNNFMWQVLFPTHPLLVEVSNTVGMI
jgi:D-alanyl-lipoteichoic acid acyltransferase DltB (MBOAT superfamily)